MPKENSYVVPRVREYLESLGWTVFKYHGGPYGVKFHPDLYGSTDMGKFFAIECKAPGEEPDEGQLGFIAWLQEKGIISFWVDSVDMLKEQLSTYGY